MSWPPPREDRVRRVWTRAKFEHLDKLLRDEPGQAEAEIAKHLHGEPDRVTLPLTGASHERRSAGGEAEQPPGRPGGCLR